MIGIYFDPNSLPAERKFEWDKLMRRAEEATAAVLESFEREFIEDTDVVVRFNQAVWRDIKAWMLKYVFHDKCAYCERLISGFTGDAEHYRPKGAVRFSVGATRYAHASYDSPDGKKLQCKHPGYFWLAYDWRNLVPACKFCNSGTGKNETFEVRSPEKHRFVVRIKDEDAAMLMATRSISRSRWRGFYYLSPPMLDEIEDPVLLNPLNPVRKRDPSDHLIFGIKGTIAALNKSEYGLATINMFHLKSPELMKKRQEAQEQFQDRYFDAMRSYKEWQRGRNRADKLLEEYRRGRYPFSASALGRYKALRKLMAS